MRVLPAAALVLALTGPACNSEYENPFGTTSPTVPPPSQAALVFTSNSYTSRPAQPRDLFSITGEGATLTRLTFCNTDPRSCDTIEAAPSSDRRRMAMRRVSNDTNGDGRLTSADGEALVVVDLSRGVEGEIFPASARITSVDWSPVGEVLVYCGAGGGGLEDLYRTDPNGQNNRNLTTTPVIRERRARIDPTGSVAVYERIDETGKGAIWIFNTTLSQTQVTSGGSGTDALPGTPYVVGSDADPAYSPDGRSVVFRRLTGLGVNGLGNWDIVIVRNDGTSLAVVATGGDAYRGAPDWGPSGIVFDEIAPDGVSRLIVIQPDGSGRRETVTLGAGFVLTYPRWLR